MLAPELTLAPVPEEAARKETSLVCSPSADEAELSALCASRADADTAAAASRTVEFARSLATTSASHPSATAYLGHPLRVAQLCVRLAEKPSETLVSTALLHNVFEVCALTESDLEAAGMPSRVGTGVRVLTIDRSRERDPAYLAGFHADIEAVGTDLALIRVVDKLDNLLGLRVLEDGDTKTSYLDLAERFVQPMAGRLSAPLGAYFAEVVAYQRAAEFDPALSDRHQQLGAAG